MSWSWITKAIEKKIMGEVGKQLNLDISKDGSINIKSSNSCRFCGTSMSLGEVFCPQCSRSQKQQCERLRSNFSRLSLDFIIKNRLRPSYRIPNSIQLNWPYRMSYDGPHLFWSRFTRIAQINLMMLSSELVAIFLDETMKSLNGWLFGGIRSNMHYLS